MPTSSRIIVAALAPAVALATIALLSCDSTPSSIEDLEGLGADDLRGAKKPLRTFLDDDREGNPDTIDAGIEAYDAAAYLFRPDAPNPEFEAYRRRYSLPSPSERKLVESLGVGDFGKVLRDSSTRLKETYWKNHFETNQVHILEATRELDRIRPLGKGDPDPGRRPTVMVLGAGACNDIPLEELARSYRVILVDIDSASMVIAIQELPAPLQKYVIYEVRDLSGGFAARITEEARRIIDSPRVSFRSSEAKIVPLFLEAKPPVPLLEGTDRVDLLISSMLVSQIPEFIRVQTMETWIDVAIREHLVNSKGKAKETDPTGEDLHDYAYGFLSEHLSPAYHAAYYRMLERFEEAHAEALRDYAVRSGGVVYYSSDLEVIPRSGTQGSYVEFPREKTSILFDRGSPVEDLDTILRDDPALGISRSFSTWQWNHQPPELQPPLSKGSVRTIDAVVFTRSSTSALIR